MVGQLTEERDKTAKSQTKHEETHTKKIILGKSGFLRAKYKENADELGVLVPLAFIHKLWTI